MRRVGVLVFVGALAAAYFVLERLGDPLEQTNRYATRATAEADGVFARGWLPGWLPDTATDICEFHSLDTNEVCASFAVSRDTVSVFRVTVSGQGFAPATSWPSPTRCQARDACGFGRYVVADAAPVLAGAGPLEHQRAYLAFDPVSDRVRYWVVSR